MKKVLVITPFFYPHVGGSEGYMEDLYGFVKAKNPNIRVDVLCYNTNNSKKKELYRGLNIFRIPCFTLLSDQFCLPKPLSLLKFLYSHRDYDLIHCNTRFFDSSWWGPVFAKLIGARVVLTDHCANHPTSDKATVRLAVRLIEATVVKATIRLYDQVFVQSKKTQEFLANTFNVKSKLAYPGISENFKLHKKKHKVLTVTYVGRMIKSKGVETLFNIAKEMPDVNFVFAGDGPMLIHNSKLSNVKFLGNISKAKVLKLLSKTDIFAYPSWHSEGIPMAIVEAGQAGLAVLATDTGAISEVIDGNRGILVKVKDQDGFKKGLILLIKNKALRKKLGLSLQNFVFKSFNWENASNLVLQELN